MAIIFVLVTYCNAPGDNQTKATRKIFDMAGREVALPGKINSIGTFGAVGVLNAFVEAMGDGSKIINRLPPSFANTGRWRYQLEFAPQIKDGPLFEGTNRDLLIENVLLAKPDISLTMSREIAERLEKMNIPCVYLEWKDVYDIKAAVELMGRILNKPESARRYLTYFDQKISFAKSLTSSLDENDKPRVLYGNPAQFTQPHQIAEWWITQAGGRSVTSQSMTTGSLRYNIEDLLLWDPEAMILLNPRDVQEMKDNVNFQNISAVKNNVFHYIPTVAHTWGNRTVEQPLTILWALHKLHPQLMPKERLAAEIRYFYSTFFLYEMNDTQLIGIIGGEYLD
ncbi:MAG: ABC transporter substrate-binding protein [Deltaproteobacteria bacterium]|nr:ABC transporter substrate-binding protein [Deltaproteobacteria bacterium]